MNKFMSKGYVHDKAHRSILWEVAMRVGSAVPSSQRNALPVLQPINNSD